MGPHFWQNGQNCMKITKSTFWGQSSGGMGVQANFSLDGGGGGGSPSVPSPTFPPPHPQPNVLEIIASAIFHINFFEFIIFHCYIVSASNAFLF